MQDPTEIQASTLTSQNSWLQTQWIVSLCVAIKDKKNNRVYAFQRLQWEPPGAPAQSLCAVTLSGLSAVMTAGHALTEQLMHHCIEFQAAQNMFCLICVMQISQMGLHEVTGWTSP